MQAGGAFGMRGTNRRSYNRSRFRLTGCSWVAAGADGAERIDHKAHAATWSGARPYSVLRHAAIPPSPIGHLRPILLLPTHSFVITIFTTLPRAMAAPALCPLTSGSPPRSSRLQVIRKPSLRIRQAVRG